MLAQEIAQIDGVGQVNVGGGALPAVRVELNPTVLNKYRHLARAGARTSSQQANANRPKGQLSPTSARAGRSTPTISCFKAADYLPLIIAASHGAVVRLADLGDGERLRPGRARRRAGRTDTRRCRWS